MIGTAFSRSGSYTGAPISSNTSVPLNVSSSAAKVTAKIAMGWEAPYSARKSSATGRLVLHIIGAIA